MKIKIDGRARSSDSLSLYARIYHTKKFLPENCDVLEVGCGRGYVSDMLVERGCNVTGFDYDRTSVLSIKTKGKFIVSDFYGYKGRKKFDCVLCLEVLEHLKDDRRALGMLYRWLKPGGRLILSVPISRFREKYSAMGHLRHYMDYEKFEQLLRSCGFRVLRKEEWGSVIRQLIFSRQEHPDTGAKDRKWLKKAIKPFMYIDTRLGLSKDGLIVECAKIGPEREI